MTQAAVPGWANGLMGGGLAMSLGALLFLAIGRDTLVLLVIGLVAAAVGLFVRYR